MNVDAVLISESAVKSLLSLEDQTDKARVIKAMQDKAVALMGIDPSIWPAPVISSPIGGGWWFSRPRIDAAEQHTLNFPTDHSMASSMGNKSRYVWTKTTDPNVITGVMKSEAVNLHERTMQAHQAGPTLPGSVGPVADLVDTNSPKPLGRNEPVEPVVVPVKP